MACQVNSSAMILIVTRAIRDACSRQRVIIFTITSHPIVVGIKTFLSNMTEFFLHSYTNKDRVKMFIIPNIVAVGQSAC